jgi:hypothetical protein
VCDHRALRKYGLGCVPPFPMPLRHHLATGYLKRGTTLAELADRTGIDRQGLEATIAEFNASAAEGRDPAFGKGSRAYNRYQGDALHGPNPCVAPIKDGPFYAIKLVIGDLGTYAGIRPTNTPVRWMNTASRSQASMPPATTWRASWAATIPAPASRSVLR